MSNNKKVAIIFISFIVIFALIFSIIYFLPSNPTRNVDNGYYISTYSTDAVVLNDNSVLMKEVISVRYREYGRHGIIRALPLHSTAYFKDNGKEQSKTYVLSYSDIEVVGAKLYDTYETNNYLCLQIGDKDTTLNVEESYVYVINYKLNFGDDRIADYDQFYFNIVGNNWDTTVSNVSFKVEFSKSIEPYFNDDNYGAYVYFKTATGDQEVKPTLQNEDTLTFSYSGTLDAFSGLTLRVKMEQGFFDNAYNYTFDIVALCVAIVAIIAIILLFILCKSKFKVVPVVSFSEPKGLNSAEVGYIIDSIIENKDITSLIIYWASKGYLKIIEKDRKITLVKQQELSNAKGYELSLFSKIFANGESVKLSDLKYKLAETVIECKKEIKKENDISTFQRSSLISMWFIALLPVVALIISRLSAMRHTGMNFEYFISFLLIITASVVVCLMINLRKKRFYLGDKKYKIFTTLSVVFVVIALIAMNILTFEIACDPLFTKIISSVALLLSCIVILNMDYYTERGAMLAGRLVGLRNYIQTAEKDRLVLLVNDDPQMFYKILPFAYVLGVSDIWCKKFEEINLEPPTWYESTDVFTLTLFMSSLNNDLRQINTNFTSVEPNTSGGGSFGSGGGFSGGGIGGGGGSSW